jgi:hypothetical protein
MSRYTTGVCALKLYSCNGPVLRVVSMKLDNALVQVLSSVHQDVS